MMPSPWEALALPIPDGLHGLGLAGLIALVLALLSARAFSRQTRWSREWNAAHHNITASLAAPLPLSKQSGTKKGTDYSFSGNKSRPVERELVAWPPTTAVARIVSTDVPSDHFDAGRWARRAINRRYRDGVIAWPRCDPKSSASGQLSTLELERRWSGLPLLRQGEGPLEITQNTSQ